MMAMPSASAPSRPLSQDTLTGTDGRRQFAFAQEKDVHDERLWMGITKATGAFLQDRMMDTINTLPASPDGRLAPGTPAKSTPRQPSSRTRPVAKGDFGARFAEMAATHRKRKQS
jgi:hypothetical protein